MAKERITLQTIATQIARVNASIHKLDERMERSFAAVAEDISKLGTKEQLIALHTQVNSIEVQLRGVKHDKLDTRVTKLEDEVFGHTRG